MGKMQRDKGANFERKIANLFRELGFAARRGGLFQSQFAGNEPDVIVDDLPGLWVEAKKGKKTYPIAALKQARDAGGPNCMPVAVCMDDFDKVTVTMEWDFFAHLLKHFMGSPELPKQVPLPMVEDEEPKLP